MFRYSFTPLSLLITFYCTDFTLRYYWYSIAEITDQTADTVNFIAERIIQTVERIIQTAERINQTVERIIQTAESVNQMMESVN